MADLKACPFCGSSDGFVERYDYSSCYWQCEGCLARGPLKVIEDEGEEIPGHDPALLAWNTRAEADGGEAVAWQKRDWRTGEWKYCDKSTHDRYADFHRLHLNGKESPVRTLYTRSNAKAGEDAKDAEYGRALIVAMNCEYQHAKQMRGKKQEEWVTVYALLHRLKSAADNLTSTQRGDASDMGVES